MRTGSMPMDDHSVTFTTPRGIAKSPFPPMLISEWEALFSFPVINLFQKGILLIPLWALDRDARQSDRQCTLLITY